MMVMDIVDILIGIGISVFGYFIIGYYNPNIVVKLLLKVLTFVKDEKIRDKITDGLGYAMLVTGLKTMEYYEFDEEVKQTLVEIGERVAYLKDQIKSKYGGEFDD